MSDCTGCGHPEVFCSCAQARNINYLKADDYIAPAHIYAPGDHTGINLVPRLNTGLTFRFSGGSLTFRKNDQGRIDIQHEPAEVTEGAQELLVYLRRMLNIPEDGQWEWTVEVDGELLYTQYETRQEAADRMAVLAADDPERVMRLMRRYITDWEEAE